jgi:D-alanine-D-alanine ligase
MKIAVLLGGNSPEREVSLNSGKNISDALIKNGHDVTEMDPQSSTAQLIEQFRLQLQYPSAEESKLYTNLLLLKYLNVDLVFNGLHGGSGENGVIQTLLDQLGIKYTGPGAMACMLAMDKEISKMLLIQNGLPTAKYLAIRNRNEAKPNLKDFTFPVIVKPADGGSSLGHTVLNETDSIITAVNEAFKFGEKVLVEEFISGKEIAAAVLFGKALPLVHIKPKHGIYDYECKYTPGMSSYEVPAQLNPEITLKVQQFAVKMYNLLGCSSYSRIDFLIKENGEIYILEANTLPGMTSTSLVPKAAKASGISFEELIESITQEAFNR